MTIEICEFSAYSSADLYRLYQEVYSSADGMSETFAEKFAGADAFALDIAARRQSGGIALVAAIDGQPLAYATLTPRRQSRLRHAAELNTGVASSARGQGCGERLLRAALERAQRSPTIEIVYLTVRADNAAALGLYQKVGFEQLTRLERDTKVADRYFDAILMRRFVN